MKFSVTINDYPKHIVHANDSVGAIKKTLESIAEDGGVVAYDMTAVVKLIPPKAAPVKAQAAPVVEKGHVAHG